jgi:hypothetical protein
MDSRIIREWNLLKKWVNANGNVHSVRNFGLDANANGEDFLGHYSSLKKLEISTFFEKKLKLKKTNYAVNQQYFSNKNTLKLFKNNRNSQTSTWAFKSCKNCHASPRNFFLIFFGKGPPLFKKWTKKIFSSKPGNFYTI